MQRHLRLFAAGLALSAMGAVCAAPETLTIDSRHTYPMFEVKHMGFSLQRGRFNKTTGKVTIDREAKSGSVDVSIDAASIDMGLDAWDKHMRAEDFFNVEKHPTITFKSNKLIFEGDKVVAAEGEFTLIGVTKPLRLKVENFNCANHPMAKKLACGAEVTADIKRSDFGMKYALPGVGDEVRFVVPIEALKE